MRPHLRMLAAFALLLGHSRMPDVAHAQVRIEQPYCASSGGHGINYQMCGFPSLEACRQEILGMGGHCYPNPYYKPPENRSQRQQRPGPER